MTPFTIRQANSHEARTVADLVDAAYSKWVPIIGPKPGPVLADYSALVERGVVYAIGGDDRIAGVLVIWPVDDAMLMQQARADRLTLMRLCTHEKMTANQDCYRKRGGVQTKLEITPDGHRLV